MNIQSAEPILFDATLQPRRSLSWPAFKVLVLALAIPATVLATVFVSLGAWPVAGLYGVDIALLVWAFRASYRDADASWEWIRLTHAALIVERPGGLDGRPVRWSRPPAWLRLEQKRVMGEIRQLYVRAHGERFEIGRALSTTERAALAEALSEALSRCSGLLPTTRPAA
jgi:uncharacterized membrane protein